MVSLHFLALRPFLVNRAFQRQSRDFQSRTVAPGSLCTHYIIYHNIYSLRAIVLHNKRVMSHPVPGLRAPLQA